MHQKRHCSVCSIKTQIIESLANADIGVTGSARIRTLDEPRRRESLQSGNFRHDQRTFYLPATGRGLDQGLTATEMKRCVWVKPVLVCEVKYTEWTRDDRLRHPVFLGLRDDKISSDAIREKAS